jgi:hypothetical protein
MKIFSPILKGTTTVAQGTTNLSGSFTGSLLGTAATASYADNFTVGGTLTAQTINVQIITSSIEFNTGSTRNGALSSNTHQFTGSVLVTGSVTTNTLTSNATTGIFLNNSSGGTNAVQLQINNTSGDLRLGIESSTGGTIQVGTLAYAAVFGNQANNATQFTTNGAARMTITSAGNVGIGTSSPVGIATNYTTLDVRGTDGGGIHFGRTSEKTSTIYADAGRLSIQTNVALPIVFATSDTERMRITSGGNILIAKTNDTTPAETIVGLQFNGARILCTVDGTYSAFSRLSSDGDVLTFHRGSASKIGSISVTTSATAYNTSASDIRLKKNFENWDENILLSFEDLNPQKFNFNSQEDGTDKVKGFIAQEVVDKFPEAYPIDDNGFYSFNPSGMTIYLMKAIQELKSENDTLKEILQRNNIQ